MKTKLSIILLFVTYGIFSQKSNNSNNLDKPNIVQADTLFRANYPEGIYVSKKDFINKKPTLFKKVFMKTLNKKRVDTITHNCYFYYSDKNKKVKKVFAISYKGHLYFQIKAILKNRNKTDRAQSTNFHNTFVRVIFGGENYLYTEAELVNKWAMAVAVNLGVAGGAIANDLIKGKGIVWDFKNKEFNIFKSCKDYNTFIKDKSKEDIQKCKEHQPNMRKVRKTMDKLK